MDQQEAIKKQLLLEKTKAFIHGMSSEQVSQLYNKYSPDDMLFARRKKFGFDPDLKFLYNHITDLAIEEMLQQEK